MIHLLYKSNFLAIFLVVILFLVILSALVLHLPRISAITIFITQLSGRRSNWDIVWHLDGGLCCFRFLITRFGEDEVDDKDDN